MVSNLINYNLIISIAEYYFNELTRLMRKRSERRETNVLYLLAWFLGFLVLGIFYGSQILIHKYLVKESKVAKAFSPIIASLVPTVFILIWKQDWSLHLDNIAVPKYWGIVLVTEAIVCALVILIIKRKTEEKTGKDLFLMCIEAGAMEIPQRLMMQNFICLLLIAWGMDAKVGIPITGLVFCAGIWVQALIAKDRNYFRLMIEMLASFIFSLGIGYVYYCSGCLIYCIAAHMAERFITVKFAGRAASQSR